jgi:signal recognition particle GTPase
MVISEREKTLNAHQLTPGTPDHDRAVEEITSKVTELDKDVKIAQRKLMTENSIILHDVYKEIREEINLIAKQAGIAQVMDYRTVEANPADPNSVATMLEQNLIWYDENLEISQAIINRLYGKRNQTTNIPNIKLLREQEKQAAIAAKNTVQPRNNIAIPPMINASGTSSTTTTTPK